MSDKYFVVIKDGYNNYYAKKTLSIFEENTDVIQAIAALSNDQKLVRIQKYSLDSGSIKDVEITYKDGRFELKDITEEKK